MNYSVVEYFAEHEGYRCGYCKSKDTNFSHGMWAHTLTVDDYQKLINRGWRRSGQYCYKPTMNKTCCPQYTIRCDVTNFHLSKSQKKVVKRVNRFLSSGDKPVNKEMKSPSDQSASMDDYAINEQCQDRVDGILLDSSSSEIQPFTSAGPETESVDKMVVETPKELTADRHVAHRSTTNMVPKPGVGSDPNKRKCKKAKIIRNERKNKNPFGKMTANPGKTLEEFIDESDDPKPKHRLEIRLVRSAPQSKEFKETFDASYDVYRKYQMHIHQDSEDECGERQFSRFLVNSPLQDDKRNPGVDQGYGSFHQQYWLDDKLIAVGVLDILPNCISSVYFYYDPEYGFLSLGTYAAIREISFTRELNRQSSDLGYYYMGFYIHLCVKMRYKGNYTPSYLLCPETYVWEPIELCFPKIENEKYSRLCDDLDQVDVDGFVSLKNVNVLHSRRPMSYSKYAQRSSATDQEEVREYAVFVGAKCAKSLLLYRS